MIMNREDLITEKELAELLGVTRQALLGRRNETVSKKKAKDGTIKVYKVKPTLKENVDYIWEDGRLYYFKSRFVEKGE